MQKILGFLKNKSVGYYIAAGIALLALFMGIFFFVTYKSPAFPGVEDTPTMGNKADGYVVETIGICLLAAAAIEIAVLIVPQYRFVQIGVVAMVGLAFMKDVVIMADFFAGIANNVMYNGGHVGLNFFYFIMIIILLVASITTAFIGFYKDDAEATADMKNFKGTINLAKIGGAGALVLAAILVTSIVSADMTQKKASGKQNVQPGTSENVNPDEPVFDPITDNIRSVAEAFDYEFDPKGVKIAEQESYDFNDSEVKNITTSNSRSGHNLVYLFEGAYAEGYQGDYSETYGYIYLWEDGLFGGKINSTDIRGYWYNSSSEAPQDNPDTEDVDESLDCLNLVSNVSKYEFINFEKASGFYDWRAHIYLGFNWGTRSMEIAGYMYYPEVALAIDPSSTGLEFKVGDTFDREGWVADRILKNLSYSAVFKASEVTWTDGSGIKNGQKIAAAGEYEVTAKWNGFEAKVTVTVTE